jgi:hypothetical protein
MVALLVEIRLDYTPGSVLGADLVDMRQRMPLVGRSILPITQHRILQREL